MSLGKMVRILTFTAVGSLIGLIILISASGYENYLPDFTGNTGDFHYQVDSQGSFTPREFHTVEADLSYENVEIQITDTDSIDVRLTGSITSTWKMVEPFIRFETDKHILKILPGRQTYSGPGFIDARLTLEIEMPESQIADLLISTSSGDVTLTGSPAPRVLIDTSSGDAGIRGLKAYNLRVRTSSGDQELEKISVEHILEIESSSGNIEVRDLSAEKIEVVTSSGEARMRGLAGNLRHISTSGDLLADFDAPGDEITAETTSGDIDISLPADSSLRLSAETDTGEIRSDFEMSDSGPIEMELFSSSGDISVTRR